MESIDYEAFNQCSSLKSIVIPDNISLSDNVFTGCSSLESVTLPNTLTRIPGGIFNECTSLEAINIPNTVTSIGGMAFASSGIKTLTIPNGVASIEWGTFCWSSLEHITIPSTVTEIADEAFSGCSALADVYFESATPPTVSNTDFSSATLWVTVANYETYRNTWPDWESRIRIQDGTQLTLSLTAQATWSDLHDKAVQEIDENRFHEVTSLKISGTINSYDIIIMRNKMFNIIDLDLSEASIVTSSHEYVTGCHTIDNLITPQMFEGWGLSTIILPQNVTAIEESAFQNCSNLREVTMYTGVKTIGSSAFAYCRNLNSVALPLGLESIGDNAFRECSKLSTVSFPSGLREIGGEAFTSCSRLQEIELPKGLETIGGGAFSWTGLQSIKFPSSLTTIDDGAFGGNSHLEYVQFDEDTRLERLGIGAFSDNEKLERIEIPSSIQSIGENAFNNCPNIKDYYVFVAVPQNIEMSTFSNYRTATLHVMPQSFNNYYINTQWSQFYKVTSDAEHANGTPYVWKYFYLTKGDDIVLSNNIQRFNQGVYADMRPGSGLIVEGDEVQELGETHLKADDESGASLIGNNNITVDKLYFDIDIQGYKWYFFSFPFDVKLEDIEAPGKHAIRYYDGEIRAEQGEGGWQDLPGGQEKLDAGKGYIFQCNADGLLRLKASNPQFDKANKETSLETHIAEEDQDASWNFMGNTYTSYYDVNECGYDHPITVWNGEGYETFRPGDEDYILHPFQAFFVQKPENVTAIEFDTDGRHTYNETQEVSAAAHVRRLEKGINPERLLINLTLSDGTHSDRTRIVMNENKKEGYDLGDDAAKFFSTAIPQFYSLDAKGIQYAINERPNGEVRLGMTARHSGTYTIGAQRMDQPMLLRDLQTGITVDLMEQDYQFESEAGTFNNRFVLVPDNSVNGIAQLYKETGVSVLPTNGGLYISGSHADIYTASGATAAIHATGQTTLPRGAYIVKVDNMSTKVIVK